MNHKEMTSTRNQAQQLPATDLAGAGHAGRTGPQGGGFRIEIKRYRAVAQWRWDLKDSKSRGRGGASAVSRFLQQPNGNDEEEDEDAICGICRQAFDATCPDCSIPGDDCPPVLGACSHAFHMHCIMKWLDAQNQHSEERPQQCPMCRANWQFSGE